MAIFFFLLIVVALLLFAKSTSSKESKSTHQTMRSNTSAINSGFDIQNLPSSMSADKQAKLREIAEYCGTRYVTSNEIKRYTLHCINEDFQSMDGWAEWDGSIHEAAGQYERVGRAAKGDIEVLAYDSQFKIAKVSGSAGKVYLASFRHCSCPDFRERHLPCKHMYALRMELDDDTAPVANKDIEIFRGLHVALAGRFGAKDDINGIRAYINNNGGIWQDKITRETAALVCGVGASKSKIFEARNNQIDIFSEDDFRKLFV